eukprot:g55014.t1
MSFLVGSMPVRIFVRVAGKLAVGATLTAGTCFIAADQFLKYENRFWSKRDPWRMKRAREDGSAVSEDETHFGWSRDETGRAVLGPSAGPVKRVVICGSGWATRSLLDGLDKDLYEVRIVSPRNYFLFTPLLPSASVGTLPDSLICTPMRDMASFKSHRPWERLWYMWRGYLPNEVRFYSASCSEVDFEAKKVICTTDKGDFAMHYDILVLAHGSDVSTFGTSGVKENCLFIKEVEDSRKIRCAVFEAFERTALPLLDKTGTPEEREAERQRQLSFVVVGGGPTGVEVAAELQDLVSEDLCHMADPNNTSGHSLYKNALRAGTNVTLIQSADRLLNNYDKHASEIAEKTLAEAGVKILLNTRTVKVEKGAVTIYDKVTKKQETLPYGICVWATGVGPRSLTSKLIDKIPAQTNKRALRVTEKMELIKGEGDPAAVMDGVYAVGDCSTIENTKLKKLARRLFQEADVNNDGVLTLQELETLFEHLKTRHRLAGRLARSAKDEFETFDTEKTGKLNSAQFEALLEHIDSQKRSLPATAQAAKLQAAKLQGQWLAEYLNARAKGLDDSKVEPFVYSIRGQFAYVGKKVCIAELAGLGESHVVMGDSKLTNALWKVGYWSLLAGPRSSCGIPLGWIGTRLFGRDSSRRDHSNLGTEVCDK